MNNLLIILERLNAISQAERHVKMVKNLLYTLEFTPLKPCEICDIRYLQVVHSGLLSGVDPASDEGLDQTTV